MNYLNISWNQFHQDCQELSQKIIAGQADFDLIIAIARGGLTLGHILSDLLNLPVTAFTISSYTDLQQTKTPEITLKLGDTLHDKKILLVDDVSDTGQTFITGIDYLKSLSANQIKTASLFSKPWTKFKPDFCLKETEDWIIFPYEMKETIAILAKNFRKENMGIIEIKNKLREIGLSDYFIEKYLHEN